MFTGGNLCDYIFKPPNLSENHQTIFFRVIPKNIVKIIVFFCNDVILYHNGVNRMDPKGDVNRTVAYYLGYLGRA